MSYLDRLKAKIHETPYPEALTKPTKPSSVSFVSDPSGYVSQNHADLPADIIAGLRTLRRHRPPPIARPEVWPEIVADAVRLVDQGWAQQALALGWEPLQLWGCSPAIGGNIDMDGLAVRLCGRRIVLLDERTAILESGAGTHAVFNRRSMEGAVFLWNLGRMGNAPAYDLGA